MSSAKYFLLFLIIKGLANVSHVTKRICNIKRGSNQLPQVCIKNFKSCPLSETHTLRSCRNYHPYWTSISFDAETISTGFPFSLSSHI